MRRTLIRILDERALRTMAGEVDRTVDPGNAGRARLRVPTGQAAPPGSVRPVFPASRVPIRSRNGISIAQATATFTP